MNNDMVIDFYVVSSSIGENLIDNIAESLRLKKIDMLKLEREDGWQLQLQSFLLPLYQFV